MSDAVDYLNEAAAYYEKAGHGQVDGIPFSHVAHICRTMATSIARNDAGAMTPPISLRDRMAMAALPGILEIANRTSLPPAMTVEQFVAIRVYRIADAMMEQREAPDTPSKFLRAPVE